MPEVTDDEKAMLEEQLLRASFGVIARGAVVFMEKDPGWLFASLVCRSFKQRQEEVEKVFQL